MEKESKKDRVKERAAWWRWKRKQRESMQGCVAGDHLPLLGFDQLMMRGANVHWINR